ncbi:hypothetical protein JCM8202_001798 [Rhodotorula sphaerocarpa]
MSGRGRGRGRRVGGQTLAGTVAHDTASTASTASPSPAPEPSSRASSTAAGTPAPPAATEDAPNDAGTAASKATDKAGEAKPRSGSAAAAVRRLPSVGVGSTRAPSVGLSARTPSVGPHGSSSLRDRPVGGLLGSTSEFRPAAGAGSSAAGAAGAKAKFRPNMKRRDKVLDQSDDEDVKMEDNPRGKRPPRAPRPRQELEMTASGPMAQGPGGPPRAWGAQRIAPGSSGAAVMAASRAGTLNQMLDADSDASDLEVDDDPLDDGAGGGGIRFKAVDLNDIGLADGDEMSLPPMTLPRDPKVVRTKIRRLQARKTERLQKEARSKAKSEGASSASVKPEPGDDSLPGSTTATPAPADSKEGSLALFSVDEDKEAKDLQDLEQEEKKEIILSEAFDLAPEARGELYMFQFPRKFPNFVPAASTSKTEDDPALGDLSLSDVKPDPDAQPAPRRKAAPPPWGRFGTMQEKAARWSEHAGRIGELCVHQSGKVTLKLAGDLRYEVLPAAQPSFLQEIAVIDHPSKRPSAAANGAGSRSKSRPVSETESDSDDGSTSVSSASSLDAKPDGGSEDEAHKAKRERKQAREEKRKQKEEKKKQKPAQEIPPDSLVLLGQTSKKFIVVPDMQDLLDKVGKEERAEKEAERRAKLEKANRAAALAKKREGTAAPKREGTAAPRR